MKADRRRWVAMVGATLVVVASFLPWAGSGSSTRNSYELVRAAERLDIVTGWPATVMPGWYLVPVVVALAGMAGLAGWRYLPAAAAVIVGGATLIMVAVVADSPLALTPGAWGAAAAGALSLGAGGWAMSRGSRQCRSSC